MTEEQKKDIKDLFEAMSSTGERFVIGQVIGTQNNFFGQEPTAMPQEVLGTNTVSPLPAKLATEQAMKYWKQLQEKNFVDSHYMLLKDTTRQQAAYIAELFAEKLEIKTKWKTFEDFWHISNLAQEKNQRTELGKLPSRASEIDKIFGD